MLAGYNQFIKTLPIAPVMWMTGNFDETLCC